MDRSIKFKTTLLTALAVIAASGMAQATITVTSGDIYTADPTAVDYGAVRFKDFTNGSDGGRGGNLYLQNTSGGLGGTPGTDGRARVDGNPLWTVGGVANSFWFEYRPVAGATDLILSGATDRSSPGFSRVINDPLSSVNFISIYIQSNERGTATPDNITVNLTSLDGDTTFLPGSVSFGYLPGGVAKWYVTDPTLLANGFILSGNMVFTGNLERGEDDKVQIAFGHTVVPEPSTYLAGALLGLPLLAGGVRKWRQNRANKA